MMKTAKIIIEDLVKQMPSIQGKLKGYQAAELWPEIIDQEGKSWVSNFSSGILTIFTENPSYGQEITFEKKKIMEKLNDRVGNNIIKNIRIKIGSKS